jgi:hypothetical protein
MFKNAPNCTAQRNAPRLSGGVLSAPEQQKNSANYQYTPRVYELSPKAKAALISNGITPSQWVGQRKFPLSVPSRQELASLKPALSPKREFDAPSTIST